ncbi:hypothetical protein AYO37_01145 [Opitutia bacterium SCGC AG-212-L18]|nr:hypothetical protein AYO37_01145 [Opitutae bacterium SCGC AG-212-L18]
MANIRDTYCDNYNTPKAKMQRCCEAFGKTVIISAKVFGTLGVVAGLGYAAYHNRESFIENKDLLLRTIQDTDPSSIGNNLYNTAAHYCKEIGLTGASLIATSKFWESHIAYYTGINQLLATDEDIRHPILDNYSVVGPTDTDEDSESGDDDEKQYEDGYPKQSKAKYNRFHTITGIIGSSIAAAAASQLTINNFNIENTYLANLNELTQGYGKEIAIGLSAIPAIAIGYKITPKLLLLTLRTLDTTFCMIEKICFEIPAALLSKTAQLLKSALTSIRSLVLSSIKYTIECFASITNALKNAGTALLNGIVNGYHATIQFSKNLKDAAITRLSDLLTYSCNTIKTAFLCLIALAQKSMDGLKFAAAKSIDGLKFAAATIEAYSKQAYRLTLATIDKCVNFQYRGSLLVAIIAIMLAKPDWVVAANATMAQWNPLGNNQ